MRVSGVALVVIASPLHLAFARADSLTIDSKLQQSLEAAVEGFRGKVGIYVRHITTGRGAAIDADSLFPTASMIKVPILVKTFERIENGDLDYHERLAYHDSLLYPGVDLLGSFRSGDSLALSSMIMLMATMSDNTASLWLQHLAGTGSAVNDWLARHGFTRTRVNSRTEGRHDDWLRYGWGQTTPREMAGLLEMIHGGEAVSPAASEEMYRVLSRNYWDGRAVGQIPPTIQVASKNGAVNASRSEVLLVNAPGGDYVFCIITSDQADESWTDDNEGWTLIRTVSRLIWTHFEPDSPWRPAPGIERYWN